MLEQEARQRPGQAVRCCSERSQCATRRRASLMHKQLQIKQMISALTILTQLQVTNTIKSSNTNARMMGEGLVEDDLEHDRDGLHDGTLRPT